jgi:hypothetical protein
LLLLLLLFWAKHTEAESMQQTESIAAWRSERENKLNRERLIDLSSCCDNEAAEITHVK